MGLFAAEAERGNTLCLLVSAHTVNMCPSSATQSHDLHISVLFIGDVRSERPPSTALKCCLLRARRRDMPHTETASFRQE